MKIAKSITLDPELLDKIKKLAKEQGRTISGMINKILLDFVK